MKKIIVILGIIILVLSVYKQEKVIIPKESIRLRIIANSDDLKDQELKKEIVSSLKNEIEKIENNKTIEDTRNYIKTNFSGIEKIVKNKLGNIDFKLEYGNNYFPEKEYKNIIYKEGEYESLVITLGKGAGENFWCVLFPPICLVDEEEVEYKSIIKEIIDKYFPL